MLNLEFPVPTRFCFNSLITEWHRVITIIHSWLLHTISEEQLHNLIVVKMGKMILHQYTPYYSCRYLLLDGSMQIFGVQINTLAI